MSDQAIIEAAARALKDWSDPAEARRVAAAVLAAVTPLIEAAALEKAAQMVESDFYYASRREIIAAIRALTQEPSLEDVAVRVRNRPEASEIMSPEEEERANRFLGYVPMRRRKT